jgi:hypothetical protein
MAYFKTNNSTFQRRIDMYTKKLKQKPTSAKKPRRQEKCFLKIFLKIFANPKL